MNFFIKSYVNKLFKEGVLSQKSIQNYHKNELTNIMRMKNQSNFDKVQKWSRTQSNVSCPSMISNNDYYSINHNSPMRILSNPNDKGYDKNLSSFEFENLSSTVRSMIKAEVKHYMDMPIWESSFHENISNWTSNQYEYLEYDQKLFWVYYVDNLLNKCWTKALNILKEVHDDRKDDLYDFKTN